MHFGLSPHHCAQYGFDNTDLNLGISPLTSANRCFRNWLQSKDGVVVDDAASIVLAVRCAGIFHDDAGSVVYEFVRHDREPPSENDWEVRQGWPIEWGVTEAHGRRC